MLEKTGYRVVQPATADEAIESLRFGGFALVLYEEGFDPDLSKGFWGFLTNLAGENRRRIFVVWVGRGVVTGDFMFALSKSTDLAVGEKDLDRFAQILSTAKREREAFYRPLHDVMRELGLEILA